MLLILVPAAVCARDRGDDEWPVRIVLNPQPHVPYAPKGLPALSADGEELAFIDDGNPNAADEVAVLIVRLPARTVRHRFDLLRTDEGQQEVRARLPERAQAASEYLAVRRFQPLPLLYEFQAGRRSATHEPIDRFGRRVELDERTHVLTITDAQTGQVQLRLRRPLMVAGPPQGHPHNHCWFQGQPRQGWFDEASGLALIRILVTGGGHYCDQPDEWLITSIR